MTPPSRQYSAVEVGKTLLPVLVGGSMVAVPYLALTVRLSDFFEAQVGGLAADVVLLATVLSLLPILVSFGFGAIVAVDRALPWESALSLRKSWVDEPESRG